LGVGEGTKQLVIQEIHVQTLVAILFLASVGHISLKGVVIVELNGVVVILFCLH